MLVLALVAVVCALSVDAQTGVIPRSPISPLDPAWAYHFYAPNVHRTVTPQQGAGASYGNCEHIANAGLTWFYNWGPNPLACETTRHRVAMIWGRGQVSAQVEGDIEWVMGFNEPELATQSNITPTLGAELWREIEQDYPDKRLVSPSASLGWLTQWWNAYVSAYGQTPRVDAVGSHCYGPWNPQTAIAQCESSANATIAWAAQRGIPEVWVTEFAMLPCWPEGEAGSIEFMQEMVDYYHQHPAITRWAWFQTAYHGDEPWAFGPYCNTSLVDIDTGELTALGDAYRALGELYR